MNKLYIELYVIENKMMYLDNGFSSCHNLCSNMAFIEIKQNDKEYTLNSLRDVLSTGKYDTVYVSVYNSYYSLLFIYIMATEFPNINFTAGGPGVISILLIADNNISMLPNFKLSSETLESIFPDTYDQRQWGLGLPENIDDVEQIHISMCNTSRPCEWGKCKFCHINHCFSHMNSIQKPMINIVEKIPQYIRETKQIIVNMGFPHITLKELKEVVPIINYDTNITYISFLRALKSNQLEEFEKTLLEIVNPERIIFFIGVEFFSDRMLKYMDKGLTVDEYIDTIKVIQKLNINLHLCFILGWNNITVNDIKEFSKAMKKIDCSKVSKRAGELQLTKYIEDNFKDGFIGCEKNELIIKNIKGYEDKRAELWEKMANARAYSFILKDKEQIRLNCLLLKIINDGFSGQNMCLDDFRLYKL